MDLVHARIADLDETDHILLDVSACCGFAFDPLLVARALDMDDITTLQRLARIEKRHRLVRSAGHHFVFDHHQIQEALYEGVPCFCASGTTPLSRQPWREEDRGHGRGVEPDGGLPLRGSLRSPAPWRTGRSTRWTTWVLRSHTSSGAFSTTRPSLSPTGRCGCPTCFQGKRRLRVLLRKNDRLELLGRRGAQAEVLAESVGLAAACPDTELTARVERALGILKMGTGHLEAALAHQLRARSLLEASSEALVRASLEGDLGNTYCALGRYAEALEAQGRHLTLAQQLDDRQAEAAASINLGIVYKHLGRRAEAQDTSNEACRWRERVEIAAGRRMSTGTSPTSCTPQVDTRRRPARSSVTDAASAASAIGVANHLPREPRPEPPWQRTHRRGPGVLRELPHASRGTSRTRAPKRVRREAWPRSCWLEGASPRRSPSGSAPSPS